MSLRERKRVRGESTYAKFKSEKTEQFYRATYQHSSVYLLHREMEHGMCMRY